MKDILIMRNWIELWWNIRVNSKEWKKNIIKCNRYTNKYTWKIWGCCTGNSLKKSRRSNFYCNEKAVADANININDIDAIACTYGPGLVGALLVGVSYAKALSYALNKPLIAVNHIKGHIAANYITHEKLEPPFLCMMMSGGNTQIILVKDYNTFEVLGKPRMTL